MNVESECDETLQLIVQTLVDCKGVTFIRTADGAGHLVLGSTNTPTMKAIDCATGLYIVFLERNVVSYQNCNFSLFLSIAGSFGFGIPLGDHYDTLEQFFKYDGEFNGDYTMVAKYLQDVSSYLIRQSLN